MLTLNLKSDSNVLSSFSLPRVLLHMEGLAVFAGAIALYARESGSLWLFLLLLLVPDISMVGYLINKSRGAWIYNVAHTYITPALLAALAVGIDSEMLLHTALIWFAHIGMDRMVGYGLKYATDFQDTHLNRV